MESVEQEHVVIIKHGGLGDFIQAFDFFGAIRARHHDGQIDLVTSKALAPLAQNAPWFNNIYIDDRTWYSYATICYKLKCLPISWVYDLQTSDRTWWYYNILNLWTTKLNWSGHVKGASHYHNNPLRDSLHTIERLQDQFKYAGIVNIKEQSLDWLTNSDAGSLNAKTINIIKRCKGALCALVVACSSKRPQKRWHDKNFAQLGNALIQQGFDIVLIGAGIDDQASASAITRYMQEMDGEHPHLHCHNLVGKTSFEDLGYLFQHTSAVVGADTGLMHLAACTAPFSLTLFGNASNPTLCAPQGKNAHFLHHDHLQEISAERVLQELVHAGLKQSKPTK